MKVILYKNLSEPERMDKTLEEVKETNCDLLEGCSMVDPTLILQSNTPILANYAYIPDFGRYYFITDNTNEQGKIWSLKMHCDVISTYKQAIRNCEATLDRQEYQYNMYISDGLIQLESDTLTVTKNLKEYTEEFLPYAILVSQG